MVHIKLYEDFHKNAFKDKVNIPDYDDVLNNIEPRIMENVEGKIEYMSPDEYISECASLQGTTFDKQLSFIKDNNVQDILYKMENGVKFDIPYLDYASNRGQEGRHRAMAAKLYGQEKIPVAIFEYKNKEIENLIFDLSDIKEYFKFINTICENSSEYNFIDEAFEHHRLGISQLAYFIKEYSSFMKKIEPDNIEIDWFNFKDGVVINDLNTCLYIRVINIIEYNYEVIIDNINIVFDKKIATINNYIEGVDKKDLITWSDDKMFTINKYDYEHYLLIMKHIKKGA